ncbi:MAG: hypothetical protein HC897_11540 [Thermoanaerobaculia bacterium]|nr:hypothetical protein [Thermoanaerobaculia bacterium]
MRVGAPGAAWTTWKLKSICIRPLPKPPSPASVEIIDAELGCTVAAEMFWFHTAEPTKRGKGAAPAEIAATSQQTPSANTSRSDAREPG